MKRTLVILLFVVSVFDVYSQVSSLEQKLVNAFLYVDNRTFEENQRANNYIVDQFSRGNYSHVLKSANAYLQSRMRMIEQMYSVLSEQERADLTILVEGDLIFHYILSAAYHTEDNSIMGDIYDYLLFAKQLLLRTTKQRKNALPPSNVTWEDVQKRLGNGDAAIEFVRFNVFEGGEIKVLRMYAAVAITWNSSPILIPMTTEKNLTLWKLNDPSELYSVDGYGNALCQLVWLDILYHLPPQDISNIYFAPCGVLNQIAIESLPFDKESTVSYHYNLTRLSSTRELVNKHNLHPDKSAALYGDLFYRASAETMQQATTRSAVGTLPYSKQEINDISQLLSGTQYHVNKLSQKQGTEASFKSLSGKSPSILHLSTHGFVNRPIEGNAMQRSGLIMAYGARAWEGKAIPKDTEDGILTAAEIATLDLSGTDIVVLSACNTALGEVTTEGVWGLQRAFKQAGAQTIVMSLWQVDDEATAVFMQYFYEALLKGRQTLAKAVSIDTEIAEHIFNYPHDAIATAQRRMRQHPKYSNPYYWAGFIVVD
jgi:CHAT domain-containing protein